MKKSRVLSIFAACLLVVSLARAGGLPNPRKVPFEDGVGHKTIDQAVSQVPIEKGGPQNLLLEIYPTFRKIQAPKIALLTPRELSKKHGLEEWEGCLIVGIYDAESDSIDLNNLKTHDRSSVETTIRHEGAPAIWERLPGNIRKQMVERIPLEGELFKEVTGRYMWLLEIDTDKMDWEIAQRMFDLRANELFGHFAEGSYEKPAGWWGDQAVKILEAYGMVPMKEKLVLSKER